MPGARSRTIGHCTPFFTRKSPRLAVHRPLDHSHSSRLARFAAVECPGHISPAVHLTSTAYGTRPVDDESAAPHELAQIPAGPTPAITCNKQDLHITQPQTQIDYQLHSRPYPPDIPGLFGIVNPRV